MAATKTSDPWPHRGKDIRRDAFPSESCKAPPCEQNVINKRVDYATWSMNQAVMRHCVFCGRMQLQHLDVQKPR